MEDIEDLLIGNRSTTPPGFRSPLPAAVGVGVGSKRNILSSSPSPALRPLAAPITRQVLFCAVLLILSLKSPSQSAMDTIITKGKSLNKPLVVAGCVPQGSRNLKELEGISIVGVQQIDRVVEIVEETLKGHEVRLLTRKKLPALDLPKLRKNKFVEILPINVGCLGACTYCKTKHARGHLGSYTIDILVDRVKSVISDGVKEIWLSSEDTGAYGRDIGVNLPTLLNALVAELPADASTMLCIGMTNPPYILEHLKEIAEILRHPCVYSFLHVPVQSGSDTILSAMNREYTVDEFRTVVETLTKLVPEMHIATDIICGFPGTPAARMKKVPSNVVKRRSRELTNVFESFTTYSGMEGKVERIWITDIASDGIHLMVCFWEVIETIDRVSGNKVLNKLLPDRDLPSLCGISAKAGGFSEEPESCACGSDVCCGIDKSDNSRGTAVPQNQSKKSFIGWMLRKREHLHKKVESELASGSVKKHDGRMKWDFVDNILLSEISISILTIIALVAALTFRVFWSK
ncbi:unnamed protein product [Sphenostylis stenocarpa]|uniref:Threonylcarbamoyladenosine tRNA methylthiotransferase n=1 Tax=Sphenostylis stenocarpa TaxID=92480 RepID=A0AA86W4J5_9FABA|nr:unnamed protein product [Sphenostylis stenocarpa]